jgi:hypothetical protein
MNEVHILSDEFEVPKDLPRELKRKLEVDGA